MNFTDIAEALQQVQGLTAHLQQSLQYAKVLNQVTDQIRSTLNLDTILQTMVREVRYLLNTDRVVIYQFTQGLQGQVVVEDISVNCHSILGETYEDQCADQNFERKRQNKRNWVINNIYQSGLDPCYIKFLQKIHVQASLVVPIQMGDQLWGLLITHECQAPRVWQTSEINLLQQLATQAAVAINQAELYKQSHTAAAVATEKARQLTIAAEQQKTLFRVITKIRESLEVDKIFQATSTEVRHLLGADRVGVFRFYPDSGWDDGELISEDIRPGVSSMLGVKIHDHCFGEQFVPEYHQGRVQAVADIYDGSLSDCHIQLLEQFQVRANLVVPILKGDFLWGLLCIHQCHTYRHWETSEIEFVTQIATHLGVALQQSELLTQTQHQAEQQKILFKVITKIRESLDLDKIFQATATEVRKLLGADRVGVFRFYPDSHWDDGELVSEDVLPGFKVMLNVKIHDHCFGDQFAPYYQHGHVQAVADIYGNGLSDCHIQLLEQFQVRANLVVPLLKGDYLWGLLCIHQCDAPRHWEASEIEFVTQIATHLGVALQQTELLTQTQHQTEQLRETLKELQTTQAQLIQTEKMSSLGQLVAGVAHEINNPVNFIYGNLCHIEDYASDLLGLLQLYQQCYPQPQREIAQRLETLELDFLLEDLPKVLSSMKIGAERIYEIVQALRNFSRLDQADLKRVDIHEGIESTLMILQHRLKAKTLPTSINIVKEYGELPLVECYAGQLNQVFMNILSNAIDALESGTGDWGLGTTQNVSSDSQCLIPTISIRTSIVQSDQSVSYVLIQIADNGPGIAKPLQAQIFDPFFTTKPVGKGTGLGLSISHQIIVEKHGGRLQCLSQPGLGTEFQIMIPIKEPVTTSQRNC